MTTTATPRLSAWSRIGKGLNLPVTSPDAYEKSGLNWDVRRDPLFRKNGDAVDSHVAIVRSDSDTQLGIVGATYTPVQNRDLFTFLEGLHGFAEVTLHSAGQLHGGELVWVRARCDGMSFSINGDDTVGMINLTNGHIGNHMLDLTPMVERLICKNGLRMIVAGSVQHNGKVMSNGFRLRHTSGIAETLLSIRNSLIKTSAAFKLTEEAMRVMAAKPLTDEMVARLFGETFAKPEKIDPKNETADLETLGEDESARAIAIRKAREERLQVLLHSPTNQHPGTRNTVYSAFQTVVEYLEYDAPVRTATGTEEAKEMARLANANFGGAGDKLKDRAYGIAMELAGA